MILLEIDEPALFGVAVGLMEVILKTLDANDCFNGLKHLFTSFYSFLPIFIQSFRCGRSTDILHGCTRRVRVRGTAD
jgi:hypothetical protein